MKMAANKNRFSQIALVIMCIIFIINLVLSREYNLLWILLSGGGNIIDYLGESSTTVFKDFQLYRLITYGYTQTAIWHLAANALGLWYIGSYLENKIGIIRFMFVYHIGFVIAGAAILIFYPNNFNYGASPAIFACFGILVNWLIQKRDLWNEYKSQNGFYFLLYYFVFSNFLEIRTLLFHLFGFGVGFLLGFVIKRNNK